MKIKFIFLSVLALILPSVSYSGDANMLTSALINGGSGGLAAMMCAINSKNLNSEDIKTAHFACSRRTREASSADFSLSKWATNFTVKCRDGSLFLSEDEMHKFASNFEIVEIQNDYDEKYVYLPNVRKKTIETLKELNFEIDGLIDFMKAIDLEDFFVLFEELDFMQLNLDTMQEIVLCRARQESEVDKFIKRVAHRFTRSVPKFEGIKVSGTSLGYDLFVDNFFPMLRGESLQVSHCRERFQVVFSLESYSLRYCLILINLLNIDAVEENQLVCELDYANIYNKRDLIGKFSDEFKNSILVRFLKDAVDWEVSRRYRLVGKIAAGTALAAACYLGRSQIKSEAIYTAQDMKEFAKEASEDLFYVGKFMKERVALSLSGKDMLDKLGALFGTGVLGCMALPMLVLANAIRHPVGFMAWCGLGVTVAAITDDDD